MKKITILPLFELMPTYATFERRPPPGQNETVEVSR